MSSTPQSQARRWLRTVAREGARYVTDLPIYDDEPYACMEAAACHYDYEGRETRMILVQATATSTRTVSAASRSTTAGR